MSITVTIDILHERRTWTSIGAEARDAWDRRAVAVEAQTFPDRAAAEAAVRDLFGRCCVEGDGVWDRSPTAPLNGAVGVVLGAARHLATIHAEPAHA